jgi:hypothetical protein
MERSRPVVQITQDQVARWLAMVALIEFIRRVTTYFSERQCLNAFKDLVRVTAPFGNVNLRYTDGRRAMVAEPVAPAEGGASLSILPSRPNGQPERRRRERRRSEAQERASPGSGRQAGSTLDRHGDDPPEAS